MEGADGPQPPRGALSAKSQLTNVDVAALAAELRPLLVGARLERAYQPGRSTILLRLRRKGVGRIDLLFELGRYLVATRRAPENPDKPSMVAQVLRTSLENSRVVAFRQVGFDRLLRMDLERGDGPKSLVFELFGDGNLVLLGEGDMILLPMRAGEFSARRVKKGEVYALPPGGAHPFEMDAGALRAKAAAGRSRDLVRFLALDLGFGPLWAEELALRAGADKATRLAEVPEEAWNAVHAAIQSLGGDIARNDLAPALVHEQAEEGARAIDAVPFAMRRYPSPRFAHEATPTFREALDAYFLGGEGSDDESEAQEDPRQEAFDEARGKLERQSAQVEGAITQFLAQEAEWRADAEALYASFPQAQALLDGLAQARRGRSWAEVEETLRAGRAEGVAAALQVPELRPHEGIAVLRLRGPEGQERSVEVDLRLSVQQNADAKYEAAKRVRARRDGAETALADTRRKMAELESRGLDAFGTAPARAERVQRHFWFETYRWTVTPGGLVAVGGRSAAQNDAVVKKYLGEGDRYVHAEIHGAPSVVVKRAGPGAGIAPEDLRSACHFAVIASRAWRQASPGTAYWVTPEQVSKTPRSGEYVPKGAWMIHGKRNVEPDLPMTWWAGIVRFDPAGFPVPRDSWPDHPRAVPKLAGAPLEALRRFGEGCVRLVPGPVEPNDAAQLLAARFGVTHEEAMAVLPAGPVEILEEPALPLGRGE